MHESRLHLVFPAESCLYQDGGWEFPGGPVVRTLTAGPGLIPAQGTKIPRSVAPKDKVASTALPSPFPPDPSPPPLVQGPRPGSDGPLFPS